jgi:hypothetical protein
VALSIALTLAMLAGAPATGAHADEPARADADWILQAQLPDGAIATHVDHHGISPYLGNFAALGLAEASRVTHDPRYAAAAWRWLEWYQAHLDPSGFAPDFTIVGGQEITTHTMDSTDAYAGTFLLAVHAAWRATGDRARLAALKRGVAAAVGAIEATQDTDGLTWAKPSWHVKYLMDQSEAYAGLAAAARLAGPLRAPALGRAAADAGRLKAGVARLWDPTLGAYDWAVHGNGARKATDWRTLYPDALEQSWAVAFGLVPRKRARELMLRFAAAQPNWDRPERTAHFEDGDRPVGYWAPVAWAFAQVGDGQRSAFAALHVRAAATRARRAWPFTPADAGQLVLAGEGAHGLDGLLR